MRGYSKNPQRILNVFRSGAALTSSELIQKFPGLHRSTIYRIINKLIYAGNIKEIYMKNSTSYKLAEKN